MLRYEMKKEQYDIAYTSSFWLDTYPEALDLSKISVRIQEKDLKLYFEDFEYEMSVPGGYAKMLTGRNIGHIDRTSYEKKAYTDPDRPMVAITYDDGPYRPVDLKLYAIFEKYGCRATFYLVGLPLPYIVADGDGQVEQLAVTASEGCTAL